MKHVLIFTTLSLTLLAGEKKPLPGQAGNDDVELVASVIVIHDEVTQAVGMDVGAGYVAVRMKVAPKTQKPMSISPDDFTMISRKDGQRSQALSPGQIAGTGALVVKAAANQPGGDGTMTNGPIWGGVVPRMGGRTNTSGSDGGVVSTTTDKDGSKENPLLAVLKAKQLPEKESKDPVEGLLYFPIDGKIKPKDLEVIYKGAGGRLVIEFANPK
jgi:hypothetical protein